MPGGFSVVWHLFGEGETPSPFGFAQGRLPAGRRRYKRRTTKNVGMSDSPTPTKLLRVCNDAVVTEPE